VTRGPLLHLHVGARAGPHQHQRVTGADGSHVAGGASSLRQGTGCDIARPPVASAVLASACVALSVMAAHAARGTQWNKPLTYHGPHRGRTAANTASLLGGGAAPRGRRPRRGARGLGRLAEQRRGTGQAAGQHAHASDAGAFHVQGGWVAAPLVPPPGHRGAHADAAPHPRACLEGGGTPSVDGASPPPKRTHASAWQRPMPTDAVQLRSPAPPLAAPWTGGRTHPCLGADIWVRHVSNNFWAT